MSVPAVKKISLYLFGDNHPILSELMQDPRFLAKAYELMKAGSLEVGEQDSEIASKALETGLYREEGGRYLAGPRLVMVPAEAEDELTDHMRPALGCYVELAAEVAEQLETSFREMSTSDRFSWADIAHSVVAGMFLDLAMGSEIVRSGEIARKPTGDSVIWAFEQVTAHNGYGVQMSTGRPDRLFFAQLWHCDLERDGLWMRPYQVRALRDLELGHKGEYDPKELLYLRFLHLLRRHGENFELQVPVFRPEDSGPMLEILRRGASRLVKDAIVPALDGLVYHPWWRDRYQRDAYRHAAVRLVLEYGIDRVIRAGVLAPFPDASGLPSHWGRWLWIEPDVPWSLLPSRVSRQQPESQESVATA